MEEFTMKWNGAVIEKSEQYVTPLSVVVANQYLNKIRFAEMIDQQVKWDPAQCNVSPGVLAKSVVLSTFATKRTPLYHINQTLAGMDLEGLFGLYYYSDEFSDDAIARTLDKLYDANPNSLYTNLSLSCLAKFDIPIQKLHADTSSISLSGAYKDCEAPDYEGLSICHGYSKDHRPDLKQVMIGKIVTEHGIPLVSLPLDGNTSDSAFNQEALQLLSKTFGKRMGEMIYIADSKLINKPTLKVLHDQPVPIRLISRCPDAFHDKLAVKMKKQAFCDQKWVDQGILGGKKQCSHYHSQSYEQIVEGHKYRLIVIRTSAGRDRVTKTIAKNERQLRQNFDKLALQTFACEADAKKAKAQIEADLHSSYHQVKLLIHTEQIGKRPRGNPGKTPKALIIETTWSIQGEIIGLVEDKVATLQQKDESFVLITNIPVTEKSDREILEEYKRQYVVEVQFHLLKQPAVAANIFLKKPERIQALLMLLAVSLLIRALMQCQVRRRLETYEEKPKIGPNRARLKNPTAEATLQILRLYTVVRKGDEAWCPCRDDGELYIINTWLDLLGVQLGE
jgi:transposase